METAPVSLVAKRRLHYSVTNTGEVIIDLVTDIARRSDIELSTVDWGSATDKDQIGVLLGPLYESRSDEPFFLLNSVGDRSGGDVLRASPQPVCIDDVVRDVKNRRQELGETTSKRQVRQIIDRFSERNVISFEDNQLILTPKGQKLAYLLDRVSKIVHRRIASNSIEERVPPRAGHGERRRNNHSTDDLNKVALRLRRDRIATAWSLENADPELVDESHFYHELKRIDFLDTPNNEWNSFRWLTIENVGTDPTNAIVHKESGENKIRHEDLELSSFFESRNGQRLNTKNLSEQQPSFEQKFKIFFPQPLPPGENLSIYYRIRWPDELAHYSSSSDELVQSISFTRYKHGVGTLRFGIVDTVDHVGVDCQKLVGGNGQLWERVSNTPEQLGSNHRPDLQPIYEEGGNDAESGYMYTIESPDSPAYRIHYTPLERTNTSNDDYRERGTHQ